MTPHDFLAKWRHVELKERSASQSHFNDLCALLGVLDPVSADPTGDWFTFEKGANRTSGGNGWADVWRKGCFGWEYKGRHANLDDAYNQMLQYVILPSRIDTAVNRKNMPDADFSKWVQPAPIAEVMLFLASSAFRAITGALIPVTRGGRGGDLNDCARVPS